MTLIDGGLYTVTGAAKLLQVSPRRVRGWISGYKASPVLTNDVGWLDGSLAFSFANLMEMKFIEFFANAGVSVGSIRSMAEEARRVLDHSHPFATNTFFRTDGKSIFAQITEHIEDDPKLYDLRKKNFAMLPIIEKSLRTDVSYDPAGNASAWRPRIDSAPNVVIFPRRSFGQPILRQNGVPTSALNDAWKAEGNIETVAKWFEVSAEMVGEAITFEQKLAMAA